MTEVERKGQTDSFLGKILIINDMSQTGGGRCFAKETPQFQSGTLQNNSDAADCGASLCGKFRVAGMHRGEAAFCKQHFLSPLWSLGQDRHQLLRPDNGMVYVQDEDNASQIPEALLVDNDIQYIDCWRIYRCRLLSGRTFEDVAIG